MRCVGGGAGVRRVSTATGAASRVSGFTQHVRPYMHIWRCNTQPAPARARVCARWAERALFVWCCSNSAHGIAMGSGSWCGAAKSLLRPAVAWFAVYKNAAACVLLQYCYIPADQATASQQQLPFRPYTSAPAAATIPTHMHIHLQHSPGQSWAVW